MKVSEIKKAKEAAELLARRKKAQCLLYDFIDAKRGGLRLINEHRRDFFFGSYDSDVQKFLRDYEAKLQKEYDTLNDKVEELGIEEDEEY